MFSSTLLLPHQCARYPNGRVPKSGMVMFGYFDTIHNFDNGNANNCVLYQSELYCLVEMGLNCATLCEPSRRMNVVRDGRALK